MHACGTEQELGSDGAAYLELLKGETTAKALLHVVLDGLPAHNWPQRACCGPGKHLPGLFHAGCKAETTVLSEASLQSLFICLGCHPIV